MFVRLRRARAARYERHLLRLAHAARYERRLVRLARAAQRPSPDGARPLGQRWAAWRLGRGKSLAAYVLWRSWLVAPQDAAWDFLTGCGERPPWPYEGTYAAAALEAAVEPGRSQASRQAIGAFCVRRGILPETRTTRPASTS